MKQLFSLNPRLQAEQRRRSDLLRMVIVCLLLIIPIFTLTSSASGIEVEILIACGLSFGSTLLALVLNRLGQIVLAGWLITLSIVLGVIVYLFTSSTFSVDILILGPLLVLPVLISGMVLGPLAPFVVAIISDLILCILMFSLSNLPVSQIITALSVPVLLLLLVSVLAWLFERQFAGLVSQLTERNRELERINSQIAAQRQIELCIGDRINLLAAQVSAAFAEQTRGANDQLSAVIEVTAALEELNYTNEQIAMAAGQVAGTARQALDVAEHGGITIRYSTDAMHLLYAKVGEMASAMENLSTQAHEIDQIIELITEVADETNLLALNATIEAAGAREYGRRFAAVAGEVQRLANRSHEAAGAVREVVSEIQEAIQNSALASREGLRDAHEITGTAREIGEAIEGIVTMVQNTATLAQQISLSIQQQKSAGTQVLDTMHQIAGISDQVAYNSREIMVTMVELNAEAERLKSIEQLSSNGKNSPGLGGSDRPLNDEIRLIQSLSRN